MALAVFLRFGSPSCLPAPRGPIREKRNGGALAATAAAAATRGRPSTASSSSPSPRTKYVSEPCLSMGTTLPSGGGACQSRDARAGGADLLEGAGAIARRHLDGARRGRVDRDAEAGAQRVERRVLDAVVGRQAGDGDVVDVALAQQLGQVRRLEAGIALGRGILALVDHHVDERAVEPRMQLGARRALHAVLRPRAALGGERAVVRRMPVARRDDDVVLTGGGELV